VSLASARIESLPDSPQALIAVSDGRDPVPITKSVMILGRGAEVADVVLQSEKVSRQHAAIIFARGEFFIEDLNSTNGTLIAGRRIKRVRLAPGLSVRIGGFLLQISWNI
jgi:pSer/pThr/pTyr-binding forkhead associated (FHA) protein